MSQSIGSSRPIQIYNPRSVLLRATYEQGLLHMPFGKSKRLLLSQTDVGLWDIEYLGAGGGQQARALQS